ncbi:hypothetical protein PT177_03180 [Erysipelothrix rhusiopathiae]|uniref:hypothetical protein n=1 Tax=Erysipelothrix rhusiopathiae TaxID=1648 RepID=UPI001EDFFF40|nr:hypothetical protein [Erysipelothrix rhusiopathiae]MCG4457653.1 hypothetical protein [Erysipelothrix rhusiopathiae]MDE8070063.1 hypothetical protein [Erysipelothrix rhusiopathiae]MDE8099536.1 hypothetical protein [Erysipelothrix rhusiopathiae]MDE8124186.1 hypothetical protein [Erysipelothrix rhusiopathiae]MDE8146503.1 hypothetical protein [Erysipelothrix rhusiopathiae]
MKKYLYNKSKTDGVYHEVHVTTCKHLPDMKNRVSLDEQKNCHDAIKKAERLTGDHDFDGCMYCCENCHNG